jgi:pimeloyl-ACP methyl ester carboxylesterase
MTTHALAPPGRLLILRELAAPLDIAGSLLRAPGLVTCPRGRGETVIVMPGFGTGDRSTRILRTFLELVGYKAEGWGLGINRGNVEELMPVVAAHVAARSEALGEPVHLVGWSLGGVLAREAARDLPGQVRQVITLGTPVVGGPRFTAVAPIYAAQGFDFGNIERQISERNKVPIRVPVTSIYSKSDGVVAWRAAIDPVNRHVEHVEVRESHFSLGFSSRVFRILAERLAR